MAEQQAYVTLHCEPCGECVEEERQYIRDAELHWEGTHRCPRVEVHACDRGRGVPPPWIRERIAAREGAVRLPVGGPRGVPVAVLRRDYGLTMAETAAARTTGWLATPVEARLLTESDGGAFSPGLR